MSRVGSLQLESKHYLIARGFGAIDGCVKTHGGDVGAIGEDPGFGAVERAGEIEEGAEEALGDAAIAVGGGDGDLVDPELGGFVGVDVVNGGGEADDRLAVDGDGEVMTGVGEEL